FSEIPSVLVLIALVFQWYRSEQRTARRTDRAADRDGDKELAAYNAYLASLQARGQ
ncbi:cytochrome c oxidase assembly protein, partial [Streptomyces sp. SID7499]|nr:cytochrome c oxidase assembly protein [Streptomyces sp. SID7499]